MHWTLKLLATAQTAIQTIMNVIHRPVPRLRSLRADIDEDLETMADKCLPKSPVSRYASAEELASDLDRYLRGIPIHARPISPLRRAWHWFLALLQADMIEGGNIAVVAPLYQEAVHVLTRTGELISELKVLKDRRVYIGREKAGSRATAKWLLNFSGLDFNDLDIVEDLATEPPVDAVILV